MQFDLQITNWLMVLLTSFLGGLTKYLNGYKRRTLTSESSRFFADMSLSLFSGMLIGALCFYLQTDIYRAMFLCGTMSFFSSKVIAAGYS